MEENLSEKERLELLQKWWRENYKSILSGVIIAVVVVGGWRYWQYRVQSRSEAASTLFAQLSEATTANDESKALTLGNQLMDQYDDTPYATQAALTLAMVEVDAGKPDEAAHMLDWAMKHGKDDSLHLLARLRLARLKFSTGDAQAALDTLAGVEAGGFAALYDALRGDAYAKLGKPDDARAAYRKSLDEWNDDLGDRSLVTMKLNSLGAPKVKAPAPTPATGVVGK